MSIYKVISGLVLAAFLTACGGGGGSSGSSSSSTGSSSGTSSSSGGSSSGTTTAAAPTITVSIRDSVPTTVTTIGTSGTYTARAVLVDGAGSAISGKLVTFSVNSALATLASTTALTDSSGVANVGIAPAAGTPSGAATLSASAVVSSSSVTGTTDFASTGGGTSTGGGGPSASTIQALITDSSGSSVTAIGSSGYFAKAIVRDGNNVGISGRLVNFSLNSNLASLSSTTALTDSSGVATVGISSAVGSSAGAATLTVNATVSNASLSTSTDFAYSGAAITLPSFNAGGVTSLLSGGNAALSVTAYIGGVLAGATPVNVTLTASCGTINGSSGSAGVTTNGSGVASANYSAIQTDGTPCSGAVTLNAASGSASASPLTITVAAPSAASVAFVSATLPSVYVSGSGAPTDSVLTFKVLTNTGSASQSTPVTFTVPLNPGGVTLSAGSGTTDNAGLVTVKISSGTIPGPLKVKAEIAGGAFAESQNLTVASGPPSQRYLSVSVSTFNVEGQSIDGTNTTVTVRAADRQGNPVQDGTVINFTSNGGQIAPSCATSRVNGIAQCSVIWQSQNPRPANGRVAVLAYAVGTKDYLDLNGNNTYDTGDTLVQMGNPYRDDNENGTYAANDDRFFLSLGGTGACSGSGEPAPAIQATCDTNLATIVRQQVIVLNSASQHEPLNPVINGHSSFSFNLYSLQSIYSGAGVFIPMPAGTTITAAPITNTSTCKVNSVTNSTIANISPRVVTTGVYPNLSTPHAVTLESCVANDLIEVTVTTPSGLATSTIVQLL